MKVSVLITNYNYARYLPTAVMSLLDQTHPIDEVVIVDDGSTDESRATIESLSAEYAGKIIPVFQNNAGQAQAMNAGFTRTSAEVICMMDADDLWDSQKVERVVDSMVHKRGVAMVQHRMRHVDQDGEIIRPVGCGSRPHGDLGSLMLKSGGTWVFGATSSLSFPRWALDKILPIPAEKWRLCADGALAYAAAFLGPVVSLDDVLGGYRVHGNNNHYNAGLNSDKVQADIEMTNRYLNDFLARIGRPERVDLERNLHYRRDRFYRRGGGPLEALAIAKLITTWPLYHGPAERAKFLARFVARSLGVGGPKRR